MNKKELVSNNCQLCQHSIKKYLCADNMFTPDGVAYCLYVGLTPKEKKKRMNDKVKCDCFKLARMSKEVQLDEIRQILIEVSKQLEFVKYKLEELKETV